MLAIPIICIKVMIFLVSGHISWLLLFHISAVPKGEERTLRCSTKAWFLGLAQTFCVNFGMPLCSLSFYFIFSSLKWQFPALWGQCIHWHRLGLTNTVQRERLWFMPGCVRCCTGIHEAVSLPCRACRWMWWLPTKVAWRRGKDAIPLYRQRWD